MPRCIREGFRQTRAAQRSALVEDYVELIAALIEDGNEARQVDIAARLGVAQPTVAKMLARLAADGLVTRQPYRGVFLTEAGPQGRRGEPRAAPDGRGLPALARRQPGDGAHRRRGHRAPRELGDARGLPPGDGRGRLIPPHVRSAFGDHAAGAGRGGRYAPASRRTAVTGRPSRPGRAAGLAELLASAQPALSQLIARRRDAAERTRRRRRSPGDRRPPHAFSRPARTGVLPLGFRCRGGRPRCGRPATALPASATVPTRPRWWSTAPSASSARTAPRSIGRRAAKAQALTAADVRICRSDAGVRSASGRRRCGSCC